jgi:hypothetical protein
MPRSPKPSGDVVLGRLLVRVREDLVRRTYLNELAWLSLGRQVEEGGLVADPGGLLHVVRDDHDGVLLLELPDQVFDRKRENRVECRARLIHQQHLRLNRNGPGNAQSLLLAAGKANAGPAESVLDLIPQIRRDQ